MKRALVLVALVLTATSAQAQDPTLGFPPFGSFADGGFDAVNRQNLNVTFSIPVVSVPARGMNFGFGINYNSLVWRRSGNAWVPVSDFGWLKEMSVGSLTYSMQNIVCRIFIETDEGGYWSNEATTYFYNFKFTDPSGTVHPFNRSYYGEATLCEYSPTEAEIEPEEATDGSGYLLDVENQVYSKSGMMMSLNSKLTDPNGNYISKITVSGTETHWKDTVGRIALKIKKFTGEVNCGTGYAECYHYEYTDTDGNPRLIKLLLKANNVKTNFACSGVVEYSQNGKNLPDKVELPNNLTYTFTYEDTPDFTGYTTARLKRVSLPTGGYYEYEYPIDGNKGLNCPDATGTSLTRRINDGSSTSAWTYSRAQAGSDWKTTLTPPTNDVSTFTFNSSGKQISGKHYAGAEDPGNLKRTINTTWTIYGTPTGATIILEDGQQSKTETTILSNGNLTLKKEYGFGSGAPGSIYRTTQYTYLTSSEYLARNIQDRVTQVIVREGDTTGTIKSRTDIAYDETAYSNVDCPSGVPQHDGNYWCGFYTRGNPTTVTTYENAAAGTGAAVGHTYYDMMGNVRKVAIGSTQQKEIVYSSTHAYAYPTEVRHGPPGATQLTTYSTFNTYTGQVTSTTDVNGKVVSYDYDAPTKRITTVTRPDNATTTYAYDDSQRIVTVESPLDGTNKIRQKSYFDQLGRQFKTEVTSTAGGDCSASKAEFDSLGRPYRRSNPFTCGGSPSYWTTSVFDALGRVTSVTAPDNSQTSTSYAGNTVEVTDPTGKKRKAQTDAFGRLGKVYEPDVNTQGNPLTQETNYSYNVLDLLTQVSQGVQTRTYVYDDMGRLTQQTTPEAGTWSFQYNGFNLVSQRTDARGVITTYAYDSLNRLETTSYNVGSTGVPATPTVTYTYGTSTAANEKGRLKTVSDGTNTDTYSYDQLGRIAQIQKVISGSTYVTSFQYNLAGELTQTTYPSGRVVSQSYDALGRPTSLYSGSTPYLNSFQYNAATGQVNGFKYGNNAVDATFIYSADLLQMTGLSYKKNGDTNPFFGLSYGYGSAGSNNGQIVSITDNVESGRTVAYTYDAVHRLKTAVTNGSAQYPQWGLWWTYDRYGNRTAQAQTAGSPPTNSLSFAETPGAGAYTNRPDGYTHDASGNMTNDGLNTLTYDAENRVVRVNSSNPTYVYDGAGLRVKKCSPHCTSPTTTTVYVFSGAQVIAEYVNGAAVDSPTREYIYSGSALVATHEGASLKYHYNDHLSARVTSDSAGGNRTGQAHFPFGEQWYNASGAKLLFTSYERDPESGNDYAVFRTHISRLGRFNRPDPLGGSIGNPQSLNRYAYVLNNPVSLTDPNGLAPEDQHRWFSYMILILLGYSHSRAEEVSTAVWQQDNLWNAATGIRLFMTQGMHFGEPCSNEPGSGPVCQYGSQMGVEMHLIQDNGVWAGNGQGASHRLVNCDNSEVACQWANALAHAVGGTGVDRNAARVANGMCASWDYARERSPSGSTMECPWGLFVSTLGFLNTEGLDIVGVHITQGGRQLTQGTPNPNATYLTSFTQGNITIQIWVVPDDPGAYLRDPGIRGFIRKSSFPTLDTFGLNVRTAEAMYAYWIGFTYIE